MDKSRKTEQRNGAHRKSLVTRFRSGGRRALKSVQRLSASGRIPNVAPLTAYVLLIAMAATTPSPAIASEAVARNDPGITLPVMCFAIVAAIGSAVFFALGCKHRATFQRRQRRWRHR